MPRIISRVAAGVVALLVATATINVAQAFADDPIEIVSTPCGAGTITPCGTEKIQKCEWRFGISYDPFAKGGSFSIGTYECKEFGYKTLYKDKKVTHTTAPSIPGKCTPVENLSALTGARGGNVEVQELCFE